MKKDNQQPRKPDDAGVTARWRCDCKVTAIRWVDKNHQHPAIARNGWFCMGCLGEFVPASVKKELSEERTIADHLAAALRGEYSKWEALKAWEAKLAKPPRQS